MKHLILNSPKNMEVKNDVWGLQSDINRLFEAFVNPFEQTTSDFRSLTPNVDITESKEAYEIKAEMPGMDEKAINLSFADGMLKECSYGTFHRTIRLPDNIADDKIEASFKHGVLDITVPKTCDSDKCIRHIDIKSS